MRKVIASLLSVMACASLLVIGGGPAGAAAAPQAVCSPSPVGGASSAPPSGGFHAMTPERLLDTRATLGTVAAGCTAVVDLSGVVPPDAVGVALSVVAVDAAGVGFITVHPCGSPRPLASNLNPQDGNPVANSVLLPVDGSQRACVYTSVATQLVVDVTGWFGAGGESFHGIAPERALDTRDGSRGALLSGTELRLPLSPQGSVPAGATGVVVNVTTTEAAGVGFLTAYPCGSTRPWISTGNYVPGEDRALQVMVGLGSGDLCIYASATVHVIVDVAGWFEGTQGTRASTLTGTRVVDSRVGTGGWSTPIQPGQTRSFDPTVAGTVPVGGVAVLDVAATGVASSGYVTFYPCGGPVPATSTLNPTEGREVANVAVTPVGEGGLVCVFSTARTDLVVDVNGSFGAAGALRGLAVDAGPLTPSFSPDGHDYGVRCHSGANPWTVSAVGVPGSTVTISGATPGGAVTVTENQLVTVTVSLAGGGSEQYFVRCLPHDFPDLRTARPDDPTPGWYLTTTGVFAPAGTSYALILDDHGAPVWYRKTADPVIDMKLMPDGNLVWAPLLGATYGVDPNGAYEEHALDGSLVRRWTTVGTPTDHHDLEPLPNGNVLMISYHERSNVDLTALGGTYTASETVVDGWIQEVRPDGTVAWEWRSEDHIAPVETTAQLDGVAIDTATPSGRVVDLVHLNSVGLDPATGNVVVSARHMDAVFEVRRAPGQPDDGKVLWKLGGSVPSDPATVDLTPVGDPLGGPKRQHDARLSADGHLTMFDNRTNTTTPARGVDYRIDPVAGTARLVWAVDQPDGAASFGLGSLRRQPDGTAVIAWGGVQPLVSEIRADGTVTFELRQSPSGITYRSLKEPPSTFDAATLRAAAGS